MRDHIKKHEGKNYSFYRYGWGKPVAFHLTYQNQGYSDNEAPQIHIAFLFWSLFWDMPWRHKNKATSSFESPQYGIYWYQEGWQSQNIVLCFGKKSKYIEMPWNLTHVRHSIFLKDGTWEHSVKGDRKDFYKQEWDSKKWTKTLPYIDKVLRRGQQPNVVDVELTMSEREWRMRWFKWTTWGGKIRRSLDANFSQEVGKGRGSWKGGTIGAGANFDESGDWLDGYDALCKRTF